MDQRNPPTCNDFSHMLDQLQTFTVTQTELVGTERRAKRFLEEMCTAVTALGALFNLDVLSVKLFNITTIKRHVGELQPKLPEIQDQLKFLKKIPKSMVHINVALYHLDMNQYHCSIGIPVFFTP